MLKHKESLTKHSKGGRPKSDPHLVRTMTIGVRVCPHEYAELREKASIMGLAPAQWLREAALSRQLPLPPVPTTNREHYAKLARLVANLNQLARAANEGQRVIVPPDLLDHLVAEVKKLRLALLGVSAPDD